MGGGRLFVRDFLFSQEKIQIEQFYYILFPLYFISLNPKFSFEVLKPLIVQGGEREAQCQ